MANFTLDKKKEHEALAEKALKGKDYAKAFYHTAQAAKYAYALADKCEGLLKNAYEANATDLVAIAEELKRRAQAASGGKTVDARETGAGGEKCRVERPDVRLDDVAGMQKVKDQIRLRLIEPLKRADAAKKHGLKVGGGILLYGPPGTGKTFIAKAVAGELDLPFYAITSADVFGKYVGESENNIRDLFREARKNPLSVIFIDELETIFRKRTESMHETTQKVITVILQELDGINDRQNPILLLGATNTPWMIDEAFLRTGRFDVMAYVGLPDADARKKIVTNSFKDVAFPVEPEAIDFLVASTDGYSGADLKGIAQKVKQLAFDKNATIYAKALFEEALKDSAPSCNAETMAKIEAWEKANEVKR